VRDVLVLTSDSANGLFTEACRAVRREGIPVRPRGLATREILGAHLRLTDPRRRLVDLPPGRVINPAFAVAEAMWILSGSDQPWIYEYNRNLARYADNGTLQGAYGPRLRRWHGYIDQLGRVRDLLRRDRDSRQAVVQLFDPERDWLEHRDVPCTLGWRFFIRGGRLHMHTTMRSQDLWLGFCYDLFTNTLVQELMAGWLGVGLGEYHHHVDSLHIYEPDLPAAASLPRHPDLSPAMQPVTVGWDLLPEVLTGVITGAAPPGAGTAWVEFAKVMASYRIWTGGDRPAARGLAGTARGEIACALERWYDHLTANAARSSASGSTPTGADAAPTSTTVESVAGGAA
jgi:thymidylate synthase